MAVVNRDELDFKIQKQKDQVKAAELELARLENLRGDKAKGEVTTEADVNTKLGIDDKKPEKDSNIKTVKVEPEKK